MVFLAVLFAQANQLPEVLLDPLIGAAVSMVVIPVIHGLVSRLDDGAGVKTAYGLALSALAGLLNDLFLGEGGFDLKTTTAMAALTFVMQLAMHYGVYSNLGGAPLPKATGDVGLTSLLGRKASA